MSMEMHVLFRGKLPDRKTLSRTMAELGFPFTIAASVGSLEKQSGFMPMWLRREEIGVEFAVTNNRVDVAELKKRFGQAIDPTIDRIATFRWFGDEREMLAGLCGAAALVKLVNGIVFDGEAGLLMSIDEAIADARQRLQSVANRYQSGQRGTRPADIKDYLKPLLKERSDLVLVGRHLLIRPVRHVARGAVLGQSGDEYRFVIVPYLHLLCSRDPVQKGVSGPDTNATDVWHPHFEPLLMDVLANDIFGEVRSVVNLDEFAATLPEKKEFYQRAVALALSRGPEHGIAYVKDVEHRYPDDRFLKPWYPHLRVLFERGTEDICARFHAAEQRTAKELKLDGIWELSPFPIELPAAQRKLRSDEPVFNAEPWPARPSWLLQEMPKRPGEVYFAKEQLFRGWTNPLLVARLSREDAEERHRNGEKYVLAARLPDGLLLLLDRHGSDRHNPKEINSALLGYLLVELHGIRFVAQANVFEDRDVDGMMDLEFVTVYGRETRQSVWEWSFDHEDGEQSSHDYRAGSTRRRERLSDVDISRLTFPSLAFGEFQWLVQLMLHVLRNAGYGELA
jgi:hypothetical protein